MASFVSLRLLGFVCFVVSIQQCAILVRAQDATSLRRAQVDQLPEIQMTGNERTTGEPDSSTRILLNFFHRRAPKAHPKPPPPPPPVSPQHSPFPPPPRKPLPENDLFAAKYSQYTSYYKVKSAGSKKKSKRHHGYYAKGGKPVPHYDTLLYKSKDMTDRKWTQWGPFGVRKGKGKKGYHTSTGGGGRWKAAGAKAKVWWEQVLFVDKPHHAPPPPTHLFPPAPADGPTALPQPLDTPGTFTILATPVTGQAGMEDQFGRAVASSRFGNYMAVGSPNANGSAGLVRVYQLSNGGSTLFSSWDQVGQDILGPLESGETTGSLTGFALDINDDGTMLVVGDLGVHNRTGQVRVFSYNAAGNRWVQRGNVISGENAGNIFGAAVFMSSSGDIVAIGAPGFTTNSSATSPGEGENVGQVRAYIWNSSVFQWDAFGSAMFGAAPGDLAGFSVSLSADGHTMAYGIPTHDVLDDDGVEVFVDAGQVRVVTMDTVSGDWISLGNPINGIMDGAEGGWDVELSGDGTRIIVGMPGATVLVNDVATDDTGIIRVYQHQESSSSWIQYGQEFVGTGQYIEGGETPGSRLGQSVAMSSDGTTIAFSAGPVLDDSNSNSSSSGGRVPVYVCNAEDEWIQRDSEIIVDTIGPRPYAVSLSANGSIILVGAIGLDDVGSSTGYRSSSKST